MKLQAIPTADYLDIVFDNRNKAYGAYELRKNYNKRTYTSFLLLMSSIVVLSAYTALKPTMRVPPTQQVHGDIILTDITPPPIVLPKQEIKPYATEAPKLKTEKFNNMVVVQDMKVKPEEHPTENSKLNDAVASNKTSDGTTNATTSIVGNSTNTKPAFVETPATTTPLAYVEEMPEFNGDISKYIGKQLRYPDAARENDIDGKVMVQFVVNENGDITNAKVLRGIGGGCDEEALRVVRSMPRWKPGKQNGKAVKVYYTLPIRFLLS